MHTIHVIVVTTNALTRSGIQQLVTKSGTSIQVMATFAEFSSLERFLKAHRGDVLVIDDSLPRPTNLGREVKRLTSHHPGLAILMIAHRPTASLIQRLLEQGAHGFLHKDDDLDSSLNDAIVLARKGGTYLSPGASRVLKAQRTKPDRITERDLDVLQLTADGFEAKEISAHLGFSDKTIYRILAMLREVFGAQNNANLIDIAHQLKLLAPHDPTDQS
jgi:DNA-binding NarL/FixJ family response regulator